MDAVIVAIAKDEDLYIVEWIKHHIDLGFDEILIYDNYSKNPIKDIVSEMSEDYKRKIIVEFEESKILPQDTAYQKGCNYYLGKARWVAYIDLDEFVICKQPLKSIVNAFSLNPLIGCLLLSWKMYGADGQVKYDDKPVMERFKKQSKYVSVNHGKTMSRPEAIIETGVHFPVMKNNIYAVQTNLDEWTMDKEVQPVYDLIYINHYFTKSYEEWLWKIDRGSCDERYLRKYDEFFLYNPDMKRKCYDRKLKNKIQKGCKGFDASEIDPRKEIIDIIKREISKEKKYYRTIMNN